MVGLAASCKHRGLSSSCRQARCIMHLVCCSVSEALKKGGATGVRLVKAYIAALSDVCSGQVCLITGCG